MQTFARNPVERQALSQKHLAVVGQGSGGSAIGDMAARAGVGRLTLIDPDVMSGENIGRHMLTSADVGRLKVQAMRDRICAINPECRVEVLAQAFSPGIFGRVDRERSSQQPAVDILPDLVVSCVDSFRCESAINRFGLDYQVPVVYGGVWGAASIGEILFVIPGQTPCYECYAGFRRSHVEIPADPRKYTDPNFDDTRTSSQPGLWSNILVIAGLQFQVVLGVLGLRPIIDPERTLWLFNVSEYDSYLQPLAVTFGKVAKGCPVCDEQKLSELGRDLIAERP